MAGTGSLGVGRCASKKQQVLVCRSFFITLCSRKEQHEKLTELERRHKKTLEWQVQRDQRQAQGRREGRLQRKGERDEGQPRETVMRKERHRQTDKGEQERDHFARFVCTFFRR